MEAKAKHFTSLNDPAVAELLLQGAIGVIPTDTVYGLVGAETVPRAINRMYSAKQRNRQPGTTIAANVNQLRDIGFPLDILQKSAPYWPAPLSVEMSAAAIPHYLSAGQPVMAARVPEPQDLRNLLKKTGALMTTSANAPGQPTATNIKTAMQYFGDSIDFYVDTGELGERPPSTIIGFNKNGKIAVYRKGAVKI